MKNSLLVICILALIAFSWGFAQPADWATQYVTFDNSANGTGYQTSSVAAVGPNRFVALVTQTPFAPILDNLFNPPGNYLVGYWDADSAVGRVPSPIDGQQKEPAYSFDGQFTDWEWILDLVKFKGAWQLAADTNGYVYVANNDDAHNILVFELTSTEVISTPYRMETGTENIFGIEVDNNGYVYVVDYQGSDQKTDEVRVYAGIDAPGTTWGDFGGHNDAPTATIDLPPGVYQGITVNDNGTEVFISATSQRSIWKYSGDPVNGYTMDANFSFTLSPDDTVGNGGNGTPSVLGLAYLSDPPLVFAAVDTFLARGVTGGYPYGRIYAIDAASGTSLDTIDIAQWNFLITGAYDTGSNNGRAGGFTSVCDVDIEPSEKAVYSQTFYGWAVEKWVFGGDLNVLGIEQVSKRIPEGYTLSQNYPNPFNPATTIRFDIRNWGPVTLQVFNVMGQKVATLINSSLAPGSYEVIFDGAGLPSGIYFYQLTANNFRATRKMVLTR